MSSKRSPVCDTVFTGHDMGDMMDLNGVCTIAEFAELHELDVKRLRRYIRNNDGGGIAVKFNKTWVVDVNADAPMLPTSRGRVSGRDDGRRRYVVYMNDNEFAAHIANVPDGGYDPRERARARAERKRAENGDGNDGK